MFVMYIFINVHQLQFGVKGFIYTKIMKSRWTLESCIDKCKTYTRTWISNKSNKPMVCPRYWQKKFVIEADDITNIKIVDK